MKKSLLILLTVFLLFFFISCSSSNFDPERDKKVLWEACEIPPPQNTKNEGEEDIIKSHGGVVSKFYSHESGCLAVERHYETVLRNRGWEKVPKSFFTNPDYIYFRKGDVTISLSCSETRNIHGIKRFSIDCSK